MTTTTTTAAPTGIDGRDPTTETWLDALAIPWQYDPAVPLDRIDLAAGLRNQARTEPLDPDTVDRYVAAMTNGDQFPPVLLRRRPRSRHLPLGGNHRLASHATVGHATTPAYLLDIDNTVIPVVMYRDNATHGNAPSRDERTRQAIHLIEACGYTQQNAAAAVGVPQHAVSTALTRAAGHRRAHHLGVGALYDLLPAGHQARLATIGPDAPFTEAVRLTRSAGLTQPDVAALIKNVKAARSETAALELIATETEDRRAARQHTAATSGQRRRTVSTPYTTAMTALRTLSGLRPADIAAACPGPDAARDARRAIKTAFAVAQDLDAALKAR